MSDATKGEWQPVGPAPDRRGQIVSYGEEPARASFYGADLTKGDVDALEEFFAARVTLLAEQRSPGSGEARMACALELSVGILIDELSLWFDDGEPATLTERMRAWNRVVFSAWPSQGTAGYDEDRWQLLSHANADAAEKHTRFRRNLATQRRVPRAALDDEAHR
ncbi:hypothetical protein [Streptomyces roseifaciens]|uniref:hypothetical protein n=1 Tax=Streptomyces roseifaciens TaxID=1488406 RepID=UPI001187539F|nr:hypothetical protein [Streptomyces roseifaciens]